MMVKNRTKNAHTKGVGSTLPYWGVPKERTIRSKLETKPRRLRRTGTSSSPLRTPSTSLGAKLLSATRPPVLEAIDSARRPISSLGAQPSRR